MGRREDEWALEAARKEAVAKLVIDATKSVSVGWDGFLDRIYRGILLRSGDQHTWMQHVRDFSMRIQPGQSANIEWVLQEQRLGGNAILLAAALAALESPVNLIATMGSRNHPDQVVPPFSLLGREHCTAQSCGEYAVTDALEFSDGKIFFGQMNGLLHLNWETLIERVGEGAISRFWNDAEIVCLTNWTMTPHMTSLWQRLQLLGEGPEQLLVDLAEPSKRTDQELLQAIQILDDFSCPVILAMNTRECIRVSNLFIEDGDRELDFPARLKVIQERLPNITPVFHSRTYAIWRGDEGVTLRWDPIENPQTLTGAGDHFNAGLVLGVLHRMSPLATLICASLIARQWVMNGRHCTREELLQMLKDPALNISMQS